MKKYLLFTTIATILLLALAACGGNNNTEPDSIVFSENTAESIPTETPLPHPFAVVLAEYLAGGMSTEDMREHEERVNASWMGPVSKAVLADIDNDGTPGMLAFRLITPDGSPYPVTRLFALYDGIVSYLDVGGVYATDVFLTEDGRVVEAMSHWGFTLIHTV